MQWSFSEDRPIYAQIIEQIQLFIVSGAVHPGERLPSVRELAENAGVNPNTMQKALAELERTGLVHSQRTSGRFITEQEEQIQRMKDTLASEKINTFLQGMKQIGYTKEQVIEFIQNCKEVTENE